MHLKIDLVGGVTFSVYWALSDRSAVLNKPFVLGYSRPEIIAHNLCIT